MYVWESGLPLASHLLCTQGLFSCEGGQVSRAPSTEHRCFQRAKCEELALSSSRVKTRGNDFPV